MKKHTSNRRQFIKSSGVVLAGAPLMANAASYRKILGANDRVRIGVVGINSRGNALLKTLLGNPKAEIIALADADRQVLDKRAMETKEGAGAKVKTFQDYREMLTLSDLDAVTIATADHTHAPYAIYALKAGKNVYVEKPPAYNPAEGMKLAKAVHSTGHTLQVGNQQRSGPTTLEGLSKIRDGLIGDVYNAKAWYANDRGSIGEGKEVAVPDHLDWDQWQGPAPRRPYKDNYVHYNWHWFKHWGTGEICNNALHELDICRWCLDLNEYPVKVTSTGGRFHFQDDWEFYDTQTVQYEYANGKHICWEGRSCNGVRYWNRGRGVMIYGTEGSMLLDRNGYIHFNRKGDQVEEVKEKALSETTNLVGAGALTVYHMDNWLDGIQKGAQLNSGITEANLSNHLCHLGNMSQAAEQSIHVHKKSGEVIDCGVADTMWARTYEPGWEV